MREQQLLLLGICTVAIHRLVTSSTNNWALDGGLAEYHGLPNLPKDQQPASASTDKVVT